jgi:hypothetical protein
MPNDPNLIPAGDGPGDHKVPALAAITKPLPVEFQEKNVAFWAAQVNTNFIREDGKKISFLHHFHETNIKGDIAYLEKQLETGFVRYATPDEIKAAHMRLNPKETIRGEVIEEVRASVASEERAKLIAQLKSAGIDTSAIESKTAITDASKIEGATTPAASILSKLTGDKGVTATAPVRLGGISGTDKLAAVSGAPATGGMTK